MQKENFIKKIQSGGSFTLTIEKKPYELVSFLDGSCPGVVLPGADKPSKIALSEETAEGELKYTGYDTVEQLLEHKTAEGYTIREQLELHGTTLERDTF